MEAGYKYDYQGVLPISTLGLVDDVIGVTEVGYKSHQMNVLLNVKTAEKRLQFGRDKCKSMIIGKSDAIPYNYLSVDTWKVKHEYSEDEKEVRMKDCYEGPMEMEKVSEFKYLGFIISNHGNNMANIQNIKNKSIGTIKKILNQLESLNLKTYHFECGIIFMNVLLRSSILYASETYYNLTELEMRQIERIEESYMRQLVKTKRSCPVNQLYF